MRRMALLMVVVSLGFASTILAQSVELSVSGTIESTSGGFQFPDGSVQTTAAASQSTSGVIEIDPADVAAGGITPSDTPGFPVTLDQPGRYRLLGDLNVQSSTGIVINAEGVILDLNGFTIRGDSTFETQVGTAIGISGGENVRVMNGQVIGMGGEGIRLDIESQVEDVLVSLNQIGVSVNLRSRLVRVTASRNRGDGFLVGDDTLVLQSVANRNGGDGLDGLNGIQVIDSQFSSNGGYGASLSDDCFVRGNVMLDNTNRGLSLFSSGGYTQNVINGNNGGNGNNQVADGGRDLGHNICGGDTTCP